MRGSRRPADRIVKAYRKQPDHGGDDMTRIFESGAPRNEYEKFERDMAARQGLIRACDHPRREPPTPLYLPPVIQTDFSFQPKYRPAPEKIATYESGDHGDFWIGISGTFGVLLVYSLIATGITEGLVWIGLPRDLASTAGCLWLPAVAAAALVVAAYRIVNPHT